MGNHSSKSKSSSERVGLGRGNSSKQNQQFLPFLPPPPSFCPAELTPPLTADRKIDTLDGLPDDVLALIFARLSVKDLGRVALVCKEWRRVSLKDSVWTSVAKADFPGKVFRKTESIQSQILDLVTPGFADPFFFWVPKELEGISFLDFLRKTFGSTQVNIALVNTTYDRIDGAGKSALIGRFVQEMFREEYDPEIEDVYAYMDRARILDSAIHQISPRWDVFPNKLPPDVFVICSEFSKAGEIDQIQEHVTKLELVFPNHPFKVMLVRTKADLALRFSEFRRVVQWCRTNHVPILSTSALTGSKVEHAFLISMILGFVSKGFSFF